MITILWEGGNENSEFSESEKRENREKREKREATTTRGLNVINIFEQANQFIELTVGLMILSYHISFWGTVS